MEREYMKTFQLVFVMLLLCIMAPQGYSKMDTKNQQSPSCVPGFNDDPIGECASASIEILDFIHSDCMRIETYGQDMCAAASIRKQGFIHSDCFRVMSTGICTEASLERFGFIHSDCFRVASVAQDRCAAASIRKFGFVHSDCLRL